MVADTTINRVVTWLQTELDKSNYVREQLQDRLSLDGVEDGFVERLGRAMFQLNIAGANTRYADKPATQFRSFDYVYKTEFVSDVQVLKSMQCWLYQCTEGDVVKDPVDRYFDEVVRPHLMYTTITKLPEYDRAEWGNRHKGSPVSSVEAGGLNKGRWWFQLS